MGCCLGCDLVGEPQVMLPSSGAIVVGLTHALLPYGVLTIMGALTGLNPNVERAAMSLGASRFRTFLAVTLPLSLTGIAAAFLLAFSLAISAYATPAILGGPATETLATLIYKFMVSLVDWSIGSALGAVLIVSSLVLLWLGTSARDAAGGMSALDAAALGGRRGLCVRARADLDYGAVSFNAADQSRFPPVGFSLRWWQAALVPRWLGPLVFSVELALGAAVLAVLLGFPLAYGLTRYRFPGRDLLAALSLGPLALPAMVTGIGLLQMLQLAGLGRLFGLPALLLGHLIICLPFAVRTIGVSLQSIPRNAELAALSLGAPRFTTFREVTLPLAKTGVFAGGSFAFVQSFTDYSMSLFLARPGSQPITVTILSFLDFGFAPTLAAVAVLTMVVPMVLIVVVQRFFHVGEFLH